MKVIAKSITYATDKLLGDDKSYNTPPHIIKRTESRNIITWCRGNTQWTYYNNEWTKISNESYDPIICNIPEYEKFYLRGKNLKFLLK